MRPSYKHPLNKKYFHTKRKIDKKDMIFLKSKIEIMKQKKIKAELEKRKHFDINKKLNYSKN